MSCKLNNTLTSYGKDAVSVISEMVRERLGVSGSVRCIVAGDEENEVYVKDTTETLKYLDIQHPVALYVAKICQGHKDLYGCGVKSMLFLIGQLSACVHDIMRQGIPLQHIEDLLNEAVDDCIQHLQSVTVPVTLSSAQGLPHGHLQGRHNQVTAPLSLTGSSPPIKVHHAAKLESAPLLTQSAKCWHGSGATDVSVKETNSRIWTAGGASPGKMTGDHVTSSRRCRTAQPESCESDMVLKNSRHFVGHISLPGVNEVHHHGMKSATSASRHRNIMLRSRHLQQSGSCDGEQDSNLTDTSSSVIGQHHLNHDHHHHAKDASLGPGLSGSSVCASSRPEHQSVCHEKPLSFPQNGLRCVPVSSGRKGDACGRMSAVSKRAIISLPEEAQGLSHGCQEMMAWAKEVMRRHLLHGKCSGFDASLVHTVCAQGQKGRHQLLEGLVVTANVDVMPLVSSIAGHARVLLINGDLTVEFRHRGHKVALSSTRVTETVDSLLQPQDSWHCQVLALLRQLPQDAEISGIVPEFFALTCGPSRWGAPYIPSKLAYGPERTFVAVWTPDTLDVSVVLVRGTVTPDLYTACLAAGTVLVDRVPYPALHVLQSASQVDLVTYILDAHEGNVCCDVAFKPLREDWCDSIRSDRKHLVITPPVFVQTLVIRAPCGAGREIQEEEFWHCTARLEQAAADGRVLQGGGATEETCAHLLTSRSSPPDGVSVRGRWAGETALYRPVVRAALAHAFRSFSHTLRHNRQRAGEDSHNEHSIPTSHLSQLFLHSLIPVGCHGQNSCQTDSRGPDHQLFHPVIPKPSAPSLGSCPCKLLSDKNCPSSSHTESVPCVCHRHKSTTKAGLSPSQSKEEDAGTKPDISNTGFASNNHQCPGYGDISCCDPSQQLGAGEQDLCRANSLPSVLQNVGRAHQGWCYTDVWDSYSSKVNGWRSAVQCVCTLMRMDEVIVTGVDQHTLPPHSVLL